MEDRRKTVSEIHGEEFTNGLDDKFELEDRDSEEGTDEDDTEQVFEKEPGIFATAVSRLITILSGRMAFWLAGFFDGVVLTLVALKLMGKL